jgi:hypothetical protein
VRAPNLWDARQLAHANLDAARWADTAHHQSRDADQAALPPGEHLPIDTYHSELDSAGSALSAAEQAWQDCLTAATAIKTELNTAIDTCCHAIKAASGHRFARNPHGLGALSSGFTHFVQDHAAGLAKLSAGLKIASGIFTVLSVIPILDLATAPLALATAATALAIDAGIKTATGQGSWTNIGIDAALLALPGAAHLATPLLAGTRLATTTARAGEAVSTAGRATRGFTTSISTDLKATRLGIATTPTGLTTILKDGKTTGQMLTDAKTAGKAAASSGASGSTGADISTARFAQKTYSEAFSKRGLFGGQTIDDVAQQLRSGELAPQDVPINVVARDGNTLITNTRSAQALVRAGVPRESWNVVNQTGNTLYEDLVSRQLTRNGLTSLGYDLP